MIIPSQAMLISETVYVDGVPAAPTSITAVLYRIVNGVRSPSGVTVTATATANTGEYTFAWTNGAWNRTDELELRVIPVIDSVSYPATIWRSHGSVDAVMRGTDSAMLASSYTAPPTTAVIADGVWDEARAGHTTAGTFGFYLDAAISSAGGGSGGLTATETAAAVWNALAATYNTADTMGAALGNVPTAEEITAAVVVGLGSVVVLSQPVATTGQITAPIVIGDDYLAANGRAFEWTISAIAGLSVGDLTCRFGLSDVSGNRGWIVGTVSDNGDGTWKLSFDIARSDLASLEPGEYDWSAGLVDVSGSQITSVMAECRRKATLVAGKTWNTPPGPLVP